MQRKRRNGKRVLWDEMPPRCRAAATEFGFLRGMWDQWDSKRGWMLVQDLVREEWWWPWDELPQTLFLAAVDLGYDRHTWQNEEFERAGQRFLDWEEVEINRDRSGRRNSVLSDSELIFGHDVLNGCWPHANRHWCKDTMDLLAEPGRRSYCQGAFAPAYRPKGGFVGSLHTANFMLSGVNVAGVGIMHPCPTADMYCRPDWSYRLRAV